jgi:hypothetical protein
VGLERGPLSLVSTIEELLGRNSSGSALEKLALTSPTSGGSSVGIVRSRIKVTELLLLLLLLLLLYHEDTWGNRDTVPFFFFLT